MTFGFDANGRMVLYYVAIGGGLRKITPTTPAASSARNDLRMIPVTPFRAYDTGPNEPAVGVAPGKVFNGTTRRIDLHPPGAYEAALVNVTYDNNAGAGFVRLWGTHALRPVTSSLNADAANTIGANAAIVPLDGAGRFMLESTITGRIIVDVMAWLDDTGGAVSAGRFVALAPQRLVDTRIPAGTTLESGSDNPFTRSGGGDIEFDADGRLGVPIRRHGVGGRALDRRHRRAGSGRLRRRLPDRYDVEQHLEHQRRRRRHPRQHGGRAVREQRARVGEDAQHRGCGGRRARLHHVAERAGVDIGALLVDRLDPDRRHASAARVRPASARAASRRSASPARQGRRPSSRT